MFDSDSLEHLVVKCFVYHLVKFLRERWIKQFGKIVGCQIICLLEDGFDLLFVQ